MVERVFYGIPHKNGVFHDEDHHQPLVHTDGHHHHHHHEHTTKGDDYVKT